MQSDDGHDDKPFALSHFSYLSADYLHDLQQTDAGRSLMHKYNDHCFPKECLVMTELLTLVEEGWDFHCDWAMVTRIKKTCFASTVPEDSVIHRTIELFRSSITTHTVWVGNLKDWELRLHQGNLVREMENRDELEFVWKQIESEVYKYTSARCANTTLRYKKVFSLIGF